MALNAKVQNGRLVLDEPTYLPEGKAVLPTMADSGSELVDEERERLHALLDRSVAQCQWPVKVMV